jgi:hypothetical protein
VERDRYVVQHQTDSVMVYLRDSVFVRERADTVFVDRTHTKTVYRERVRVDTLRVRDTVNVVRTETLTVTTEVEVNRLTGWQQVQLWFGRVLMWGLVLIGVYLAFKWKLRF